MNWWVTQEDAGTPVSRLPPSPREENIVVQTREVVLEMEKSGKT